MISCVLRVNVSERVIKYGFQIPDDNENPFRISYTYICRYTQTAVVSGNISYRADRIYS